MIDLYKFLDGFDRPMEATEALNKRGVPVGFFEVRRWKLRANKPGKAWAAYLASKGFKVPVIESKS